jgi:hypothetical protein
MLELVARGFIAALIPRRPMVRSLLAHQAANFIRLFTFIAVTRLIPRLATATFFLRGVPLKALGATAGRVNALWRAAAIVHLSPSTAAKPQI